MDSESHAQKDGEDGTLQLKTSSLMLSRVTSAPEPIKYDGTYSPSTNFRHPGDKSLGDLRPPPMPNEASSPNLEQGWLPRASSPLDTHAERPPKRVRLDRKDHSPKETFRRLASSHNTYYDRSSRSSHVMSPRPSDHSDHDLSVSCASCWGSEEIIASLVRCIIELQAEISQALPIAKLQRRHYDTAVLEVTKRGLKHSVAWTAHEIQYTIRLVQEMASNSRTGLPSLTDVVPTPHSREMRRPSLPGQSTNIATTTGDPRRMLGLFDPSRPGVHQSNTTENHKDTSLPFYDQGAPPLIPPDELRRSMAYDQNLSSTQLQLPHASSSSSVYGSAPSPSQSQHPHRALPSPPTTQYPPTGHSGQAHYSTAPTDSAHVAHLQDLQHQISTKTLALQTLQREHDQLLAAFSRSQIRCNTLDKKSQVADHEINSLTEEKIRLQQQVESLEAQVEELVASRDDAHKQSSADGAQWRQIMAMSSQLQIKGAEEARRFKAERDSWEEERALLERRIQELESKQTSPGSGNQPRPQSPVAMEDILNSTSVDELRQDVVRLRRRCADLEVMMQDISGETDELDQAITIMANIRQRIASKRRRDEGS